jgi:hypothetical protein
MKKNIFLSICILIGTFAISGSKVISQDQITKELLDRELGVWHAESTNADGEKLNNYSRFWRIDELDVSRSVHLAVNSKTKKLKSTLHVFSTVSKSGKQTESLFFNSEGNVGRAVGIINGNFIINRIQGVNTNNIIFSGTLKKELSKDGMSSHETWNDMIFNGNYLESTPKREYKKLEATSLMQLFQEEKILRSADIKPAKFLSPFQQLLGRWEMKNKDGNVGLKIRWRLSGMGKLLVERYNNLNENSEITGGGINISGIDPSSGRLTMWSIDKTGFLRRGGWDFISDKVTGQRQNNYRLIRKLSDDNTITAYWQQKKNGEYSGENNKYTLQRVAESE